MENRVLLYFRAPWFLVLFSFTTSFQDFETPDNPSITYTYNRFSEIEKQCGPVLSSAAELKSDNNRGKRIKNELFFSCGDWDQESGGAPLMPFDDSDMPRNHSCLESLLKLASFWVMDVNPVRPSSNVVSVSGMLHIGITRGRSQCSYRPGEWSPDFRTEPGTSSLRVLFEGVYVESKENEGERLMCLLGTAVMPIPNQVVDSLEVLYGYGYNYNYQRHLAQDDQIMLILRYPKNFTVTTRGIRGEMNSLNEKSNLKYFDRVNISSQLGRYSHYKFGSEELLAKACRPYPYQAIMVGDHTKMFKGDDFCEKLQSFLRDEFFDFLPIDESFDTYYKLGPFILNKESKAYDGALKKFRLAVQDFQCEPSNDRNKIKTARASAVFRVIHSWEDRYTSEIRTGLSGMTLSAEGIWSSSGGQLCMLGCLGLVGVTTDKCSSRICLSLPLTFSIKQHSIVFGTISSINEKEPHATLSFEMVMHPEHFLDMYKWNRNLQWSYRYSKDIEARAFHSRSKPFILGTTLRKSLLWYPSLNGSDIASLSHLSNELSLCADAVSYPFSNSQLHGRYVEIKVLSVGSLFGRYWPRSNGNIRNIEMAFHSSAETIEISAHLSIIGNHFNNVSLFMEGFYDPTVGEMYLIGCRDVRSFLKINNNGTNLDGGMDCLIEIKIEYPSKSARWLINPKVKFTLRSSRKENDFLHFSPIMLKTSPINYDNWLDDAKFRKGFEGVLRILMLTMAILCILGQWLYTNDRVESSAYISLVTFIIQALGYGIPLITGSEVFFKWKMFQSNSYQNHELSFQHFKLLDSIIKVLLLVALLFTLRLYQKVLESRTRQFTLPHKSRVIPSDKKVALMTLAIHMAGFLFLHEVNASRSERFTYTSDCSKQKLLKWLGEANDYAGLVQDFFLLPQIISNSSWKIQGEHPLRKLYFFGITTVRLLLHAYDYLRDPVPELGNITIALISIILAVIMYFQHRRKT